MTFEQQIIIRPQFFLMHQRPRYEHGLLLARQAAFQNIAFKIDNNAVLIIVCVEMWNFMFPIALYININLYAAEHTNNGHKKYLPANRKKTAYTSLYHKGV